MPQIYLCFLWHMHQPFYKDLISGEYKLPWTRMHALKDYYGMVRILEEFPQVRQTFNLVPSMMVQVEEYAAGTARDPFLQLALKPAESLDGRRARHFLLKHSFYSDPQHMIYRYPRYGELFDARRAQKNRRAQRCSARRSCATCRCGRSSPGSTRSFRRTTRRFASWIGAGRNFTLADQQRMGEKQREIVGQVLPEYRSWPPPGQIEISTTPYYHPILPLLCDSNIAGVSHPERAPAAAIPLPGGRAPAARNWRANTSSSSFGVAPVGLWPSEGSVSDEVFTHRRRAGLRVGRHRQRRARPDPAARACRVDGLYRPYRVAAGRAAACGVIFRDHFLSDLIGFVYSKMDAGARGRRFSAPHPRELPRHSGAPAATRWCPSSSTARTPGNTTIATAVRSCASCTGASREDRGMLRRHRQRSAAADAARAARPHLSRLVDQRQLRRLDRRRGGQPGLDAIAARARHLRCRDRRPGRAAARMAYEELLIAEGSDWCWWYGPEHESANRPEFDQLYRSHLANVYRFLNLRRRKSCRGPSCALPRRRSACRRPAPCTPTIDGEVTSYFEWLGAGKYRVDERSGSMHGKKFLVREVQFGSDGESSVPARGLPLRARNPNCPAWKRGSRCNRWTALRRSP